MDTSTSDRTERLPVRVGRGRRPAGHLLEKAKRSAMREPRMEEDGEPAFPALHWMTATLFLAAGTEALLRRGAAEVEAMKGPLDHSDRPGSAGRTARGALRVAPLVAAPLAGAAHAARAVTNGPGLRLATQLMDGVAVGVAAAGLVAAAWDALDEPAPATEPGGGSRLARSATRFTRALVPLTFGATAILGMLLETEEQRERERVRHLERRASIVERLVPRRRARVDHIVLHI